jgi:hypothetical protein
MGQLINITWEKARYIVDKEPTATAPGVNLIAIEPRCTRGNSIAWNFNDV